MKKVLSLVLIMMMSISFVACGSKEGTEVEKSPTEKAYEISKEAYDNVKKAYEISDAMGSDIYEAWRLGIYSDDEILDEGVKFLADKLSLSEDEIIEGIIYTCLDLDGKISYEDAEDEDKKTYRDNADLTFMLFEDDLFSYCTMVVRNAYIANGKVDEAQSALNEAKGNMKELSASYSDYEHYPNLKEYYTTTSAYFDFCQNPDGSFEQIKDTLNDYRNEARDLNNDLDYIFED